MIVGYLFGRFVAGSGRLTRCAGQVLDGILRSARTPQWRPRADFISVLSGGSGHVPPLLPPSKPLEASGRTSRTGPICLMSIPDPVGTGRRNGVVAVICSLCPGASESPSRLISRHRHDPRSPDLHTASHPVALVDTCPHCTTSHTNQPSRRRFAVHIRT